MANAHQAIRADLERKVCLSCGYRGRLLQGERGLITFQCPSCGADLYARPPRSYAELEGFVEPPPSPRLDFSPRPAKRPARRQRARARGRVLERLLICTLALTFSVAVTGGVLAALL